MHQANARLDFSALKAERFGEVLHVLSSEGAEEVLSVQPPVRLTREPARGGGSVQGRLMMCDPIVAWNNSTHTRFPQKQKIDC